MSYVKYASWLIVVLIMGGWSSLSSAQAPHPPRPNFVVFLVDDLGSHDVSYRGSAIKTPNIDQLAAGGAQLDQFYVQPVCSPTRAALLTGRYPFRYGLQTGVVRPWAQYGLPLEERTLASALRDAGYSTAIVGKWHLGHVSPEYLPTKRGFEHQYGHYNGAIDYFTHVRDGGFDWHRNDQVNRDEGYSTNLIANESVRLIKERDPSRPLFLYVAFNGVHSPHQVPPKYAEPYADLGPRRQTYAGMIAAVDEAIGQVVGAIDEQKLTGNTLFIFSSDNGGPNPGRLTSNGSLRAGKGTIYEGGVRTCAIAKWTGVIPAGSTVNAPLHIVDWYPTLLRLAGAKTQQPLAVDGRDAWPAIIQKSPTPHDAIILNASPNNGAVRAGDWKLVVRGKGPLIDDEDGPDTPTTQPEERQIELYHLAKDVSEKTNLATQEPQVVTRLLAIYDQAIKESVAPKAKPKSKDFKSPEVWGTFKSAKSE